MRTSTWSANALASSAPARPQHRSSLRRQELLRAVTVFQRSPTWVLPKKNRPFTPAQRPATAILAIPLQILEGIFAVRTDQARQPRAGRRKDEPAYPCALAERHLAASLAGRPDLLAKLTPDHPIGSQARGRQQRFMRSATPAACRRLHRQSEAWTKTAWSTWMATATPSTSSFWRTGFQAANYLSRLKVASRNGVDLTQPGTENRRPSLGPACPVFRTSYALRAEQQHRRAGFHA